jgi:hypothetical protein
MVLRFPRASRSSRLPSIVPSVAAAVFGWLLCEFLLIGGHLRPRRIFLFFHFVTLFVAPKRYINALSLARSSARLPSIISPNATADFRLIVGCLDKTAAT